MFVESRAAAGAGLQERRGRAVRLGTTGGHSKWCWGGGSAALYSRSGARGGPAGPPSAAARPATRPRRQPVSQTERCRWLERRRRHRQPPPLHVRGTAAAAAAAGASETLRRRHTGSQRSPRVTHADRQSGPCRVCSSTAAPAQPGEHGRHVYW